MPPCPQVHRSLLTGVLLPLHQPNQMAVWSLQQPLLERYHEALVGCLVPFLEREPDLVLLIFQAIAEAWPSGFNSNTPKVCAGVPPFTLLCLSINLSFATILKCRVRGTVQESSC